MTSPDDLEATIATLLARWREGRQPELAATLETLSARLVRPPIPGKTAKARHEAWLACARLGDPADAPRLLTLLLEGTAAKTFEAKLETLVARGPDPRVAAALVMIVSARRAFVSLQWIWSRIFDALEQLGDPRGLVALRAALPAHEPARGFRYMGDREVFSLPHYIWTRLPPVVKSLEAIAVAPLTDADRSALAQLRAPSRSARTEAELLEAVLAAPADDAPRSVLSDALQTRGDPHGELIALQLARGRGGKVSAREKALLKGLVAQVVGPLAPVLLDPVITRGFLAGGRAVFAEPHQALWQHPWWRTLESVTTEELRLVRRRDLTALRRVQPARAATDLLDGDPVPGIEVLVLTAAQVREHAAAYATSRALPGLRELVVEGDALLAPGELTPILRGVLGARLEILTLHAVRISGAEVDAWHAVEPRPAIHLELPSARARLSGDVLELEARTKDAAARVHRELAGVQVRVAMTQAPKR